MSRVTAERPLAGTVVVSLALNLPGPLVARRLAALGAGVTKVEPPAGDPMAAYVPSLYAALSTGQEVLTLDLKQQEGRAGLADLLRGADLLLTASRPAALARLGLAWDRLSSRWPRLCQVAVVGETGERADRPGHDLTYQARAGTLPPAGLPTVLLADQAGAERMFAEALLALRVRDATGAGAYREVGLADVAAELAEPLRHGLTGPGRPLGGALPGYRTYPAAEGRVAVAALEGHFAQRLNEALGVDGSAGALAAAFAGRTAAQWDSWALEHDLPVAAVADPQEARNMRDLSSNSHADLTQGQ
jgi:alpha-methylacyl-CoA racemase